MKTAKSSGSPARDHPGCHGAGVPRLTRAGGKGRPRTGRRAPCHLLAAILALAATALASAQTDLTSQLEAIRAKHKLPGLAAMVVRADEVLAQGAAGVRQRGSETKLTIDDKFHLGSCTKSMTATLCALLVEDGTLTWETSPATTLADIGPIDEGWKKATLHQLVTNSAGAPAGLDRDGLWKELFKREGTPTAQRLQLARGVLKHPPEHEPGSRFLYSNAGFAIAGAMAEDVTGKAWETLMRERLFAPLGITSGGFGPPDTRADLAQPVGHRPDGMPVDFAPYADNPAAIGPAGTVHMTLRDWARYCVAHADGEREGKARLLKPETYRRLHAPVKDGYAAGWAVSTRPWAGKPGRTLSHNGSNTMWMTVCWLAPEKGIAIVVGCNQGGDKAAKATDEAAFAAIKAVVIDAPMLEPEAKP